jgi:hypothetical protein
VTSVVVIVLNVDGKIRFLALYLCYSSGPYDCPQIWISLSCLLSVFNGELLCCFPLGSAALSIFFYAPTLFFLTILLLSFVFSSVSCALSFSSLRGMRPGCHPQLRAPTRFPWLLPEGPEKATIAEGVSGRQSKFLCKNWSPKFKPQSQNPTRKWLTHQPTTQKWSPQSYEHSGKRMRSIGHPVSKIWTKEWMNVIAKTP